MTTDLFAILFADFNESAAPRVTSVAEDAPPPIVDISEVRQEAWTDGYLRGRLDLGTQDDEQNLAARLLTSMHELDADTARAVDEASLAVADMLVAAFIAAASADWSAGLLDRVRLVAERIKPAMTVAPEFVLRDDSGRLQHFTNLTELARALEAGDATGDVTIQWQRGEATVSRTALMDDLRQAIIPLKSGLGNEHNARKHT